MALIIAIEVCAIAGLGLKNHSCYIIGMTGWQTSRFYCRNLMISIVLEKKECQTDNTINATENYSSLIAFGISCH